MRDIRTLLFFRLLDLYYFLLRFVIDWFSFWMGHFVASVASTLRKTGTVVLLAKRPTAESEKPRLEQASFFFCKRTMVAVRSPPETASAKMQLQRTRRR